VNLIVVVFPLQDDVSSNGGGRREGARRGGMQRYRSQLEQEVSCQFSCFLSDAVYS
jgi:hypothetical protein